MKLNRVTRYMVSVLAACTVAATSVILLAWLGVRSPSPIVPFVCIGSGMLAGTYTSTWINRR